MISYINMEAVCITYKLETVSELFAKNSLSQICFYRYLVGTGSRNESQSNNGISHFIEHMLFKGTDNRSAREIADSIDSIGGQLNAFTGKECTCYYTKTLDSMLILPWTFFRICF